MNFRGLGLILYRKQTTRNPTQPIYPQTPSCKDRWELILSPNVHYIHGQRGTYESINRTDDLYDLYDLYDLAHVAGWEPQNLHHLY